MRKYFLPIIFVIASTVYSQQSSFSIDTLYNRIAHQLTIFPQEKLHLHIDKPIYSVGDTLWFQPYLIHSVFHIPYLESRYIYAELISPIDSVVYRTKVRVTDSIWGAYIPIPYVIDNGNYTIRAYTNHMKNLGEDYFFKRQIKIATPGMSQLKTYAHTELKERGKSKLSLRFTDQLFRSINLTKASLKLKDSNSKSIKIDEDRSIPIDLDMKDKIQDRSMKIEFSDQSGNSYSTYLPIATDKQGYDVTFHPEGGYLVAGAPCRVAFKALGQNGYSTDVQVRLEDSKGNILASDSTIHEGMGLLEFTPLKGEKYKAHCVNKYNITRIYDISTEDTAEAGLRIESDEINYKIILNKASGSQDKLFYFIAHVRGAIIYANRWTDQQKPLFLDKRFFPEGVIQFLLLDENFNPLSERLAFLHKKNERAYTCEIQPDKMLYGKRQKVNIQIKVKNLNNQPLNSNLSVSVTDNYYVPSDTSRNILTTLLLTSELKGYINNPDSYFQDSPQAQDASDLLMMVHGWRRYNIPEILKGNYQVSTINFERSMHFTGNVFEKYIFSRKKKYRIDVLGVNNKYKNTIRTDDNGSFTIGDIEFVEGSAFRFAAINENTSWDRQSQQLKIVEENFPESKALGIQERIMEDRVTSILSPEYNLPIASRLYQLKPVEVIAPYLGTTDYLRYNIEDIHKERRIRTFEDLLKHMGIEEGAVYSPDTLSPSTYSSATDTFVQNSADTAIKTYRYKGFSVITYVDGRWIVLEEAAQLLKLSNIKDIVFIKEMDSEYANDLLFGIYHSTTTTKLTFLYDRINYAGTLSVPFLDITTKDGFDSRYLFLNLNEEKRINDLRQIQNNASRVLEKNRSVIYPLGYQAPIEYYAPKYEAAPDKEDSPIPDYRTTIHWQSGLNPGKDGVISFSFFTADTPSTYTIVVEGISDKGDIIYNTKKIKIQ